MLCILKTLSPGPRHTVDSLGGALAKFMVEACMYVYMYVCECIYVHMYVYIFINTYYFESHTRLPFSVCFLVMPVFIYVCLTKLM